MQALRIKSGPARRLFLSGLIVYLFAVIGLLAPLHVHADAAPDQSHAHPECQLCQVSAEAFLAPVPVSLQASFAICGILPEFRARPSILRRHQPFSSRGPPAA